MQPKTREVLELALARVRRGWCKHHMAVNVHSRPVDDRDAFACKWCSLGAVFATTRDKPTIDACRSALRAQCGFATVVLFNDSPGTTFEDVERVFLQAIDASA